MDCASAQSFNLTTLNYAQESKSFPPFIPSRVIISDIFSIHCAYIYRYYTYYYSSRPYIHTDSKRVLPNLAVENSALGQLAPLLSARYQQVYTL